MLSFFQKRLSSRVEKTDSTRAIKWLQGVCSPEIAVQPAAEVVATAEKDGVITEHIVLATDDDTRCPAVLVHPVPASSGEACGIVLSHDDRQCAASVKIVEAAHSLAKAGSWVIIPDHASSHAGSLQPLGNTERRNFYGDESSRFYGPADAVGRPPLAARVEENLAAFGYLVQQSAVDSSAISVAGLGIGSIDACLAALLEKRIAGVTSVDATTVRDWATNVAPEESRFFHIVPYLPSIAKTADLDELYACVAPRPMTLVRRKDGWPRSGFEQVAATVTAAYEGLQAADSLQVLGPRDATDQLEQNAPNAIQKQLIASARVLMPTPPQPGIVGNVEGLKSRRSADSASGLIWIVSEMSGYDQEFVDSGYRLETWSFFNDNGNAQKDRSITPLIFKKVDQTYQLTGIGTTRKNDGSGLQQFPFEPVEGSDEVGEGHFFGWHTGDPKGTHNPGVVEYQDSPDAMMIILTADGQMGGQKLKVGASYRRQSQFRRRYSVMASSKN